MFPARLKTPPARLGRAAFPAALLVALAGTSKANGKAFVDLLPTQDTFVASNAPSKNYTSSVFLAIGAEKGAQTPFLYRTLLHFDLKGALPPGATFRGAALRLYQV